MGMFDSVVTQCPKCGEPIEFQSKAGECMLTRYALYSVPLDIANSIKGDKYNCACGEVIEIILSYPLPSRVPMIII